MNLCALVLFGACTAASGLELLIGTWVAQNSRAIDGTCSAPILEDVYCAERLVIYPDYIAIYQDGMETPISAEVRDVHFQVSLHPYEGAANNEYILLLRNPFDLEVHLCRPADPYPDCSGSRRFQSPRQLERLAARLPNVKNKGKTHAE